MMEWRLNKFVAQSGVASRRKAAELVKAGLVQVNGAVEANPARMVTLKDTVTFQGKKLKPQRDRIYLLLNKPKNVITTMDDPQGRKTVWDIVESKVSEKIYPVGRLDRNTTGLLLMTNDGDLTHKLSHPSSEVKKIYEVVLNKAVKEIHMDQIKAGVMLEDGKAEIDVVSYIQEKTPNHIGISLHSGKNRIIRRIFEHLGYEVVKLDRVYFAGLTKKDLPRGWSRFLKPKEIIMLKHFIGKNKK